mgnify:CR=1 FL=1
MVWVTIKEAKVKGLSRSVLYRLVEAGELASRMEGGKRLIWLSPNVEERFELERTAWAIDRARLVDVIKELSASVKSKSSKPAIKKNTENKPATKQTAKAKRRGVSSVAAWEITAPLPAEDADLINQLATLGQSVNAIEKAAGVWSGAISRLRKGKLSAGQVKPRRLLKAFLGQGFEQQAISA